MYCMSSLEIPTRKKKKKIKIKRCSCSWCLATVMALPDICSDKLMNIFSPTESRKLLVFIDLNSYNFNLRSKTTSNTYQYCMITLGARKSNLNENILMIQLKFKSKIYSFIVKSIVNDQILIFH